MELEIHETAMGPCVACGKESKGSRYWRGMTDTHWAVLRPLVAQLYLRDMVQDVLFVPQLNQPICGPVCSSNFKEKPDGE